MENKDAYQNCKTGRILTAFLDNEILNIFFRMNTKNDHFMKKGIAHLGKKVINVAQMS